MSYRDILQPLSPLDNIPMESLPSELVEAYLDTKRRLESGNRFGLVNRDPLHPNSGFDVGAAQWRNSRATSLMERLYNEDPELAKQYLGDMNKFTFDPVWPNKDKVAAWLGTETGEKVQRQQMQDDFNNLYMARAKANGIKSAAAALVWADLAHRYGVNGAKKFINPNGETDLAYLAEQLDKLEAEGNINAPINKKRFSAYAAAFGGNAAAVMSMRTVAKSVFSGQQTVEQAATDVFDTMASLDLQKIIADASAPPEFNIPDLPKSEVPASDEMKEFRNKIIMEILTAKPPKAPQDPVTVLLNALIQHLIGSV